MKRRPVESLRERVELWGPLTVAGGVICAATLFGFVGRVWWVFDLFAHFRVQYLVSISLIIALLLLLKRFRTSAVFGACAAINLAFILPYYLPGDAPVKSEAAALRAISFNVNSANAQFDSVKRFILENAPDLILLIEFTPSWAEALEEIRHLYPHSESAPREDNSGIAIYSRIAFSRCKILYLGRAGVPSVVAEFELSGRRLTVLGMHPPPPVNGEYSRLRNDQLESAAKYLASVPGEKMLLGDLNVSPWSPYFDSLVRMTGLKDSSRGRGIKPTWPAHDFWLRIPIDFCLVSEGIAIKDRAVGPYLGSDHFPLIVDFGFSELREKR